MPETECAASPEQVCVCVGGGGGGGGEGGKKKTKTATTLKTHLFREASPVPKFLKRIPAS